MSDLPVLGIDLGTTFSAMAVVNRHGKAEIVPNIDGHPTTPSVVYFYAEDACVVGDEAIKAVVIDPALVGRFIKREMGQSGFTLEYFGRSYTPQEISGIILRKLKEDAEEALGVEVRDAVITVPAYFNSAQRSATAEAGALAGLNVLSIINEPTAAAIAYGLERLGGHRRMLVFDLGGGTFDVTVMEIQGISFRTLASDGNAELGGKDWDDRLLDHVANLFVQKHGEDPRDDPQPYQELYERCLSAKVALSTNPTVAIPVNHKGRRSVERVSREEFEAMTADLLRQCAETCKLVMERARLSWPQIDDILLVGGATRMPMIRRMMATLTGRDPITSINPDEGVALGAALAGVLRHRPDHPALIGTRRALTRKVQTQVRVHDASSDSGLGEDPPTEEASRYDQDPPSLPRVDITDITSHPLGIVVLDKNLQERVVTLIPAGTPLPCEKGGRFAYAYDDMTAVRVEVTEGHGKNREEVEVMGEVVLENLPPRPRGTAIDVVYGYGIDGILEVLVVDVQTRATHRARLDLRGGLKNTEDARSNVARASVT